MNIPDFEKKCVNILKSYDFLLLESKGGNFYFEKKSFINLKLKPEQKPELKPEQKPEIKQIKKPEVKPEKKTELKPIKKQEQSNQLINLLINNANKKKQFIKKY